MGSECTYEGALLQHVGAHSEAVGVVREGHVSGVHVLRTAIKDDGIS